jgi:hypothetical protein
VVAMMSSAFASSSPLKQPKCVVFGVVGKGNATTTIDDDEEEEEEEEEQKEEEETLPLTIFIGVVVCARIISRRQSRFFDDDDDDVDDDDDDERRFVQQNFSPLLDRQKKTSLSLSLSSDFFHVFSPPRQQKNSNRRRPKKNLSLPECKKEILEVPPHKNNLWIKKKKDDVLSQIIIC